MKPQKLKSGIAITLGSLLLGLSCAAFCRSGQPAASTGSMSSLCLSLGISGFNQRDRYLSPYVFSGTIVASSLSYRITGGTSLQRIEAFISMGALNSDEQPRDVYQDVGLLSYSYLRKIVRWDGLPLELFVGGGLSSLVMNTDFNTVDNVYGTPVYDESWYWHHSMNLVLAADYFFDGRENLSVELTAPVIGLVSRPNNGHWLNQENNDVIRNFGNAAAQGRFEPFWRAPVVLTTVEYTHSITKHLNLRGSYSFAYITSDRPSEILAMGMYMNNVVAGAEWVF